MEDTSAQSPFLTRTVLQSGTRLAQPEHSFEISINSDVLELVLL